MISRDVYTRIMTTTYTRKKVIIIIGIPIQRGGLDRRLENVVAAKFNIVIILLVPAGDDSI